ncbi:hypothetical protein [Sulfurimonas sp. HSL3-7]|uniref:hypothetical protein n=1 Tax=Sulfonitrofixus jiaomeiensis TaxID=3131938 RepID=UPI0031F80060
MDDFEKLQELGSKKIASATHIPVAHVEAILNKEFTLFAKAQFFGFLSILEREYKVDLSALKQEYLFARAQEEMAHESSFEIPETAPKLFEKKKVLYGASAVAVVLVLILLFTFIDFSVPEEAKIEINNTAIDQAKKNLNLEPVHAANVDEPIKDNEVESAEFGQDVSESNATAVPDSQAQQVSAQLQQEPLNGPEPTVPLYLRIVPHGKLWLGIIDAETHKRKVKIITEPLDLDGKKEWLIMTGYGYLDMECGDTTKKYRVNDKLLFLYESGVCHKIDEDEFKARNKGKLW